MFKKIIKQIFCLIFVVISFVPSGFDNSIRGGKSILTVPFYKKILEFFLPNKNIETEHLSSGKFVYVSGYPLGFTIDGAGAIIVEKSAVITEDGYKNPTENKNVLIGDIIKEVEGLPVTSGEAISEIVNRSDNVGKNITIKLQRKDKLILVEVKPEYDIFASSYRLGLWVRDNAVGVGMMTFVTEEGKFASLGHPITDIDTGSILPVMGGRVYKCSIIGAKKGEKGSAGELKGLFLKTSNTVGSISENKNSGVYGTIDGENIKNFVGEKMEVALPEEIKMGSATLISTVDGISPKCYEIEIIKTNHTASSGEKCMVIRIKDSALIETTGGIVQGMSGSPIVQNGKLIGCVTHVFISDPEKGFARFATTLLE